MRSDHLHVTAGPRRSRAAFSMVELLIALAISATLLTATMVALSASFKSYQLTTESASTHVVSRLMMHRMLAMVRTGTEFGPFPANPLTNPTITSDYLTMRTESGQYIEIRYSAGDEELNVVLNPGEVDEEIQPMLGGVSACSFELTYDVGPKLRRASIDITIEPNDDVDLAIEGNEGVPPIRLVSSVSPRRLE
ncbi:MAG: prepilin-type N-terminal cleavage/methylation domain-containing protein [Phycisphaerales bacterium]|nr:prepilin-type N-terminal cleavage/methylation domain-containing protein [Phycisphaerales bacterium]